MHEIVSDLFILLFITHVSCLVGKMRSKILINCKKNYNGYNLITKEERMLESPLYLKLGSSCSDGE